MILGLFWFQSRLLLLSHAPPACSCASSGRRLFVFKTPGFSHLEAGPSLSLSLSLTHTHTTLRLTRHMTRAVPLPVSSVCDEFVGLSSCVLVRGSSGLRPVQHPASESLSLRHSRAIISKLVTSLLRLRTLKSCFKSSKKSTLSCSVQSSVGVPGDALEPLIKSVSLPHPVLQRWLGSAPNYIALRINVGE